MIKDKVWYSFCYKKKKHLITYIQYSEAKSLISLRQWKHNLFNFTCELSKAKNKTKLGIDLSLLPITQSSRHQVAALPFTRDMKHHQLVSGLTLVAIHCVHSKHYLVETDDGLDGAKLVHRLHRSYYLLTIALQNNKREELSGPGGGLQLWEFRAAVAGGDGHYWYRGQLRWHSFTGGGDDQCWR